MSVDKEHYPLVSVLIPAYNRPYFLEVALKSVLQQTYKNVEIVICDDSTNDEVNIMIQPYLKTNTNIRYYNNGGPLGKFGLENSKKCFSLAAGEYINYLFDDDVFSPTKLERMVEYLKDSSISLVTSHRSLIDSKGNVLPDGTATVPITNVDTIYEGVDIGTLMLIKRLNFIGEPTTVLFRKKDVEGFGVFMGRQYECIVDMAMWLSLLQKGKCVYISDTLSYFRMHAGRNVFKQEIRALGLREMRYLSEDGCKAGFITK